ncbi:hypothetical protein ACLOJK_019187 [Asimina triloba]
MKKWKRFYASSALLHEMRRLHAPKSHLPSKKINGRRAPRRVFPKRKKARSDAAAAAADRLSNLPTPLLHHILSFLPTNFAVQTCLLSKTWQNLWHSIHSLDLDEKIFPSITTTSNEQQQRKKTQFPDFVHQLLLRRDGSNLKKFRLCLDCSPASHADRWLCYAAEHSVQEIEMKMGPYTTAFPGVRRCLPHLLFACESLVDIKLQGLLKLPDSRINLPNLQSLKLDFCTIPNTCIQQIFPCCPKLNVLHLKHCTLLNAEIFDVSCCPCLETLILEWNRFDHIKRINISAPQLKSLIITNYYGRYCSPLKISAPNLLHLEYNGHMPKEFCIENLQNLLDAVASWDAVPSGASGREFRKGLLRVGTQEILSGVTDLKMHLPTSFSNLKFLELVFVTSKIDAFEAITLLLKFCPYIETLVIEMKINDGGCQESEYYPREWKLNKLKVVEIKQFEGSHIELKLIKLLLKSAMVLERMIFTAPKLDLQKLKEISLKLQTYPRASLQMLTLIF